MKSQVISACVVYLLTVSHAFPCTIISGTAKNGVVWAGNNEDWVFDFNTLMNVLPREGTLLGGITFTYGRPDATIQGGVNEKGLFFDLNAVPGVPAAECEGWSSKRDFPGSGNDFVEYILRHCSTVPEVLSLFNQYRWPALLAAQMHLADRWGNLAVVNADGTRLIKGGFQVTTNFNVRTRGESAEAKACWRFPIAERMLQQRGASLENFKDILDVTQQPVGSTVYGNVVNLTTGDIYLYYAGDYQSAVHLTVGDLLARGRKSYVMRSLYPEAAIVKVWNAYQAEGVEAALRLFGQVRGGVPEKRRPEVLRNIFTNLLLGTSLLQSYHYTDAKAFFGEWMKETQGQHPAASYFGALVQVSQGNYQGTRARLIEQLKVEAPEVLELRPRVEALLARLEGNRPVEANARSELKGQKDAKFVALVLPDSPHVLTPLLRTPDGWAGDFGMPPGKVHYAFVVDGTLLLDPANLDSEIYTADEGSRRLNIKVVR